MKPNVIVRILHACWAFIVRLASWLAGQGWELPADPAPTRLSRLERRIQKAKQKRFWKKHRRAASRQVLALGRSGYQCPRCWEVYETPEERRECRAMHRASSEVTA